MVSIEKGSFFIRDLVILSVFCLVLTLGRSFSFAWYNLKASKRVFEVFLKETILGKISFFDKFSQGFILTRFQSDTESVDTGLAFDSNILLKNIFDLLGTLVVLIFKLPYLLVCVIFLGVWFFRT